jgi:Ca2+-transporting ATPase
MAAFVCLVLSNLGLIFTNRSWSKSILALARIPNPAQGWVSGGALAFLALILAVPLLRNIFYFAPLHGTEIAIIAAATFISLVVSEGIKHASLQGFLNGIQPEIQTMDSHDQP